VELLKEFDVECVRADNPGPFTLDGSNCWLIGRDPCWIIDPGPPIDAHLDRLASEAAVRGGVGGIAITHDHADHSGGLEGLLARVGEVPVGAAAMELATVSLADGDEFGPLSVYATPGHAPDHLAFVSSEVIFTGDAVLGEGSVYIAPDEGALIGYLEALDRLIALELKLLCPGHGPALGNPRERLTEYRDHRLERERKLVEALAEGLRGSDQLLEAAWGDVPPILRPAAEATLAAHVDKLASEGRLPEGVERPSIGDYGGL
jgi:glyoxylase-like metal-dependent hydrolase (beta-lactamase superfamily II)